MLTVVASWSFAAEVEVFGDIAVVCPRTQFFLSIFLPVKNIADENIIKMSAERH